MTSFGQYPLVYQLKQQGDGSFIPIGLAETSAFPSLSAVSLVVSSISATNYQGINFTGSVSFTGVLSVDATGDGISFVVTGDPLRPKIRGLSIPTNGFLTPTIPPASPGDVEISWGGNPLTHTHGGTNSVDTPTNNGVAHWDPNGGNPKLITVTDFTYTSNELNIPSGGKYKVGGNQITLNNIDGIQAPNTLANIPIPTLPNTYLIYNGTGTSWSAVTGTGGASLPTNSGRIPITNNATTLDTDPDLTYNSSTKVLTTYSINNVCDVCAVKIIEGGQQLSVKYQGKDDTLVAIAGLNPGANQLIYFTDINAAATAALTDEGRQLLDDTTFAAMRSTLQLGNIATRDITSPPAGGLYFENDPTGTFTTDTDLTFDKGTNTLKSPTVCATTVCATTIQEGGQTLTSKYLTQANAAVTYQPCDVFLNTLATNDAVRLDVDVTNTLPVTRGGTGFNSIANNEIVVGTGTNTIGKLTAPTTNNTFLKYTTGGFIWTGTDGGSISLPGKPYSVLYENNAAALAADDNIKIQNGIFYVSSASATTNVSAGGSIYGGNASVAGFVLATGDIATIAGNIASVAGNMSATNFFQGGTNINAIYQPIGNYQPNNTRLHELTAVSIDGLLRFNGSNYVTQPTATYETTANANSKYLTINNAATTYQPVNAKLHQVTAVTTEGLLYFNGTSYASQVTSTYATPGYVTTQLASYTPLSITGQFETTANAQATYLGKISFNSWSGALALSAGLLDVQITAPTGGQALKWNNSLKKWTNQADDTGLAGGTPGGGNRNVQINYDPGIDAPVFSGNEGLTYDLTTSTLRAQYYSNLPSGSPYWNANQLSGIPIVSGLFFTGGPRFGDTLGYFTTAIGLPENGWYYTEAAITTNPGGSNTQIQFNNTGSFSGSPALTWNNSTSTLTSYRINSPASVSSLSLSALLIYPTINGTPKRNWVFYGRPQDGAMFQNQNFWFSAAATIPGVAGTSSTLFTQRFAAGGAVGTAYGTQTSFLTGRFISNAGAAPGYETDYDPPSFLYASSVRNNVAFFDTSGQLCNTSSVYLSDESGDPLATQLDTIYSVGVNSDYLVANQSLDVVLNAIIGGQLRVGTVSSTSVSATNFSATNYFNLPSSTVTWLNATNSVNTERVRKYVKNMTGATIPKGRPVTITGATGDNSLITPLSSINTHVPEAIGLSNHVFGLTETEIANDSFGYILTEGMLSGTGGGVDAVNTAAFAAGDILYVSSNGLLSNVRPPAPYEAHPIGYVVRSHANVGSIYVKIETVPEINDIVGFNLASSLVNGDLITYDLTTSTFVNTQSINLSGSIKGGSVSATTYLNLPSGTAIWNANKIQSVSVCATAPSRDNQLLAYDLVANSWKAGLAVSSGSGAPTGGVDGDIYIQYFDSVDIPADASSLRGYQITSTAPVNNNILRYNGTAWVPSASAILQSVSAASYLNYPSTQAAGTVLGAIQYNTGANGFDADDSFYYASKILHIQEGGNGGGILTDTINAISVSSTTVSATTYLNLPSGVATWNASALRGFTVSSTTPTNNRVLTYVSAASAWNPQPLPAEIGVACSDETTNLTSGTAKATFRMPYAMTLTSVRANVNTAPVGSTILVDVNKNGSTIFSTRVSIDASEKTSVTAATPFVLSTTSLADDDEITVDIDQVGSSTPGKGLKIWLIGTRA